MKRIILIVALAQAAAVSAQNSKQVYPTPEYSNEIYLFNKDSASLVRLEKGTARMKSHTKMGGMAGMDNGYTLEGNRSPLRLSGGQNLHFVFFKGDASSGSSSPESDSVLKANGMDPAMMSDPMSQMQDPSRTTTLYGMNTDKSNRSITLQSYTGMKLLGGSKKESTKYTLSIKKIRNGYYELVVDKPLPRGEYAFLLADMGAMDGSSLLFAFGVD